MPMPLDSGKRIAVTPEFLLEKGDQLLRLLAPGLVLDAGVDVLGVLAEDDHVHQLGLLDRGGHPGEVADRPDAGVEIELLPEGDVERAESAADRGGERPLDGDEVVADRLEGVVGEPVVELVLGLLAGEDLEPDDLLLAAVRLLHRGIEDPPRRLPDVGAGAVTLDEGDDWPVRHGQVAVLHRDGVAGGRFQGVIVRHGVLYW